MPNGNTPDELVVPSSLSRLSYFYGQLLAQRDLVAEQDYHVTLRRMLQRELFGTGTTAGLAVEPAPLAAPRSIVLRPGLALDPDGRELVVDRDVVLEVAGAPVPVVDPDSPLSGTDTAALGDELATAFERAISEADVRALETRLTDAGLLTRPGDASDPLAPLREVLNRIEHTTELTLEPGTRLVDHLFDALVGVTYLGLRYLERGAEPAPAMLDGSCCGEVACFPARLQQGVCLVTRETPFPAPPDPARDAALELSACLAREENPEAPTPPTLVGAGHACGTCLTDLVLGAWRPVPATLARCGPATTDVVPLAAVSWSRQLRTRGGLSRILSVDNHTLRPLAPGGPVLRGLFDALVQCVPSRATAPVVRATEPAFGERLFVADGATEVSVRASLSTRVIVVGGASEPRWELDIYPAAAGASVQRAASGDLPADFSVEVALDTTGDHTDVVLRLFEPSGAPLVLPEGTYVWRVGFLDGTGSWDLVAETTGQPLDGNPRASAGVPSGDGRRGGTFESRFHVIQD